MVNTSICTPPCVHYDPSDHPTETKETTDTNLASGIPEWKHPGAGDTIMTVILQRLMRCHTGSGYGTGNLRPHRQSRSNKKQQECTSGSSTRL